MPYRFDSFVFDKERGLLENGEPVPLEPQGLELLGYLLEHRDRVVSRDELNEEIWDGRIVSEAALSTCIRALRRALGDDRTQQKYIRTYPKRGFQFVAPVNPAVESDAAAKRAGHVRPQSRRLLLTPFLVAVLVVVFFGMLGGWWMAREGWPPSASLPELSIAVLPFDNLSGDPGQDYFVDAFTEDLITNLSRIRDAFVIARRTSFTYKR